MIKEMFVSSTPHETKVAITEDDQLAEIFYERENEYTLAGSIYKGRVTRVLPGMQSAFVDIGLERDAFLYVSDFLDLGTMEEEEDIDEVPIPPQAYVTSQPEPEPKRFDFLKSPSAVQQEIESVEDDVEEEGEDESDENGENDGSQQTGDANRDFRGGRRRRRGRRGRGFPENKFARPGFEQRPEQRDTFEHRPTSFEPRHEHRPYEAPVESAPEGYEPVVLPGESISKYRRGQTDEHAQQAHAHPQESIATVADVPPEQTHEPLPIVEDALPVAEPVVDHRQAVPDVLPGESLRKYRRGAEPEQTPEPSHTHAEPRETRAESPAKPAYKPSTLVEHPAASPEGVVSPFVLPGESLRKYQKSEHSQPDSPVSEHESVEAAERRQTGAVAGSEHHFSGEQGSDEHGSAQQISEEHSSIAASEAQAGTEGHAEQTVVPAEAVAEVIENATAAESVTPVDGPVSVLPATTGMSSEETIATAQASEEPKVATKRRDKEDKEPTEASVRMDTRSQVAPFVLPGESLRKYSRKRKKEVVEAPPVDAQTEAAPETGTESHQAGSEFHAPSSEVTVESTGAERVPDDEATRLEEMNVASAFAGEEADHDVRPTPAEREVEAEAEHRAHDEFEHRFESHEGVRHETGAHDETYGSVLASLPTDEAQTELADARPQFTDDEKSVEDVMLEEAARHRRERMIFEPTPAGTMEHEEIESDDIPDDEHDFHQMSAIGTEEDALFEELEETTLAPQAAEALNDERAEEPFVIEGGYEFEHAEHGAGVEEPDEDVIEEEETEEEEHATHQNGAPAYPQRRPFDRRRGRRGGRRGNFPSGGGGGRPPRRDVQRQNIQIADLLKEGQEVLIQIAKEPIGKKGARITSHIALPGRFLVYMPTVNHIGVSRKINSEEERQRLKRIMISEREGGHGGFIVRTAAAGITEEELRADIRFLKNLWNEIRTRAEASKPPALIYHDLNLVERVLRDQVTSDFSTIWVDTEQEYERILRFANRFQPSIVRKVKLYTKETPLYEQFGIQDEINKGLRSKVWLKSGGYIVINQTEALVAIDINTGKYVGKTTRLEDTIVKTNIDAIKEIVRQIRLRDLGGIIVIDFIDMDERKNRQKVMQALEEALKADRAPSKVLQFNDFGLVAITRKRVKQSLERTLGQPCPYCTGNGFVKSVTTVCNEIYVEARKLARHLERDSVILRVNPEVAKALKGNGGKMVNEIEELTGRTIIVKSDAQVHTEQFDFN